MFGLGRLGKLGAVGRALAEWTPAQLWPLGASSPGMWIDPSTTSSMYQDSAGTTAISAIGTVLDSANPVGLALDRKGNLELSAELVTNGDFSAGTTGWSNSSTGLTVTGGVATSTNSTGSTGYVFQALGITTAKSYKATISVVSTSGLVSLLYNGTTVETILSAPGIYTLYYVGQTGPNGNFSVVVRDGASISFDNVSVKEIPGIHLSQATSTSRPVASARKNELVGTAALATQNVTSKALQYVLSFWGTGSVTLSGTSTAGPLAGTGAGDRVSLTFTPTAGTLTLTVSGTVTNAQLEVVG